MITPLKLNMAGSHGFLSNARIFVTLLCLKLYTIMPSRLLTLAMAARQDQPPILPAAHNSVPDG